MLRQHSNLIFICVLSLLLLMFSYFSPTFAQDSANGEKTVQPNNLRSPEYDIIMGTALDLDGNLSYVEIVDSNVLNTLNEQVTVSAWIKPTNYPNIYATIIFRGDERVPDIKNRSYILNLKIGGFIQLASSPEDEAEVSLYSPPGVIKLNTWTHIAGVIDPKNDSVKLFIDGLEVSNRSFRGKAKFYKSQLPLRIGWTHEEDGTKQSPFVGQMDEVSIWNIALTENQIQTHMKRQLTGKEKGLVGYWKFDEETDGIISDVSPNQNDGILIGNAKLTDYIRPVSAFAGPEQLAKAAIAYKKMLTRETNFYEAFRYLAEIYIKTERFSEAEKIYFRALEAALTQAEHNDAISALWKLYTDRDAVEEFTTLLEELKPKMGGSSILHELLGDAYKKAGETEKAELAYTQWIDIRKREVNRKNSASEYHNLAEVLLNKNLFPEIALELAIKASQDTSSSSYNMSLAHALLVNELYEEAFQLIESILDRSFFQFVDRDLFKRIVKAGRNVTDKKGFVEMLNNLIDAMRHNLSAHINSTFALAQFYKENDQHEKAKELIQKTGFITEDDWMILGPFDNIGEIGYNTEYIPENLPQIDLTKKYDGIDGKVGWRKSEDDMLNAYISLGKNVDWSVAYAFAIVTSPDEREVEFRFDSDDQGKVWLNGIEVFVNTNTYSAEIDRHIFPVTLNSGKNSILVKVCEINKGWGFYFRITDQNGKPFDDLKIDVSEQN